jgi:hypothetical protein
MCDSPWVVSILAPDGTHVVTHAPAVGCMGYGHESFTRGETLRLQDSWNGTRWVSDATSTYSGSFQPVTAGTYTWRIEFDASLEKDEGDAPIRLRLDLPLVIP